jgi:hypothetical protein
MTQPLSPPYFSAGYNVGLTDIGSGYAKGITSAGQSIAGAIGSVMGSVNPQTGEAQEGILQQGQSAHNLIDVYHQAGLFDDATYEKLKTSGLGAQQKALGAYTGALTMKYQTGLEMEKIKAQEAAAMARQQVSSGATIQSAQISASAREQAAETRARAAEAALAAKSAVNPLIRNAPQNPQNPQPPNTGPLAIPSTLSLRTGY